VIERESEVALPPEGNQEWLQRRLSTTGCDSAGIPEPERWHRHRSLESRVYKWLDEKPTALGRAVDGAHTCVEDSWAMLHGVRRVEKGFLAPGPAFFCVTESGRAAFFECKRSLAMEREQYESLMALDRIHPVWIIVETIDGRFWSRVSVLGFVDSRDYVARFGYPFEVESDGWIVPRLPRLGFSGRPFKVINTGGMRVMDLEGER
jgi:hypothetical protein